MSTETTGKPTLIERLTSATGSRDLTVALEGRGDADYLIAASLQPAKLGRLVYQMMSEWDARPKPRALTAADIERVAQELPPKVTTKKDKRGERVVESLDIETARAKAAAWMEGERHRILAGLPTFRKLVDLHAGFMPWVLAQGITSAREKLEDVLLWWVDRRCLSCGGTNLARGKPCRTCHGFGTREVPHGREGLAISEHIAAQVDAARGRSAAALKQLPKLKAFAAGRGLI